MRVKKTNKSEQKEWDMFIDHANNGTIFHKLQFLSYHPKERFTFHHLSFYNNDKLIACLPGGIQDNVYVSPLGASYGSFATTNITFKEYEELIDTLLSYVKTIKLKGIKLTPPPIFYLNKPHQIEPFLLEYKGFKVNYHLISNAVNLHMFNDQDVLSQFTDMHKRAVKKGMKLGVTVKQSDDINMFYKILLNNKRKFHTTPTHSLDELITLKKLFPNDIKLFMAYDNNEKPIAGILLFVVNQKAVLAFYISHYFEYQELRAVNVLFYEIIKWSLEKGYEWFDLGVSMDTSSQNPMEPSRSLIFFKEGIQSRGFLRTTFTLKI